MYTIMNAVQLVMAEKQLAGSLWNEIAAAMIYIQNRCPNIEGKTPFEKCNNQLPDVSNLRVLGCQAWVCVPDTTSRSIMDLRSWQSIMIGYEANN